MGSRVHGIITALLIVIALNLFVLDVWVANGAVVEKQTSREIVASIPTPTPILTCPQSCVDQIHQQNTTQASAPLVSQNSSAVKEFFISFGSGQSSSDEWSDVGGVSSYIDTTKYDAIQKVTFEASANIPTGNQTIYIRLFNVTDKHPVWFSEVSLTGGSSALLVSDPITLDSGNKLYQVQMKTQLKFLANLTQARVHILTQ